MIKSIYDMIIDKRNRISRFTTLRSDIIFRKVKAYSNNIINEECDKLAKAAIGLIKDNVLNDPNFKGIGVWSYNQKMYWPKDVDIYTPASPSEESMDYLNSAMPAELISSSTSNHDEL